MKIVEGGFFGRITPNSDPGSGRTFFFYSVGKLKTNEIFFNGAAGDAPARNVPVRSVANVFVDGCGAGIKTWMLVVTRTCAADTEPA